MVGYSNGVLPRKRQGSPTGLSSASRSTIQVGLMSPGAFTLTIRGGAMKMMAKQPCFIWRNAYYLAFQNAVSIHLIYIIARTGVQKIANFPQQGLFGSMTYPHLLGDIVAFPYLVGVWRSLWAYGWRYPLFISSQPICQ